ncbi:MAG: bifunctional UDP-N-acetylglucosamine pyrophosphorylase/glucosamine-1-phosphate N-acetyltransferase [Myxococcota bacterium]|jgi:bifunctional UDP-N-acetylglucosamine pyrophosphorylase/glucosamine-1-phosphate N-acetyltransferase
MIVIELSGGRSELGVEVSDESTRAGVALILAAGRGTRMRSRLAKVLHPLLGLPMARFSIDAAVDAGLAPTVIVHHQEDQVRAGLAGEGIRFVRQEQTRGTGDAVASALPTLPASGVVVVLCGDTPLVRGETLKRLLAEHGDRLATVISTVVAEPARYGRLVRDDGPLRIVEASSATPEQLAICEINTGIYAFDAAFLHEVVPHLPPNPPKGEIYLTDVLQLAAERGRAGVLVADDPDEFLGVNDRVALAQARSILQKRHIEAIALSGVTFEDPGTTLVEAGVQVGPDTIIAPGVVLRGQTRIGEGSTIGAHCVIADTTIGDGVTIKSHSVCEGATVADGASVGPFARLRPAADIGAGAKIGNFVEVKKSTIAARAKVSHLSYIGDATIGPGANIGAGTITCNYDGFNKHRTTIGADAFIGSNTALVAPVTVGEGAIVGAGSVITRDVPDDALALGRGRQTNMEGRALTMRERLAAIKRGLSWS